MPRPVGGHDNSDSRERIAFAKAARGVSNEVPQAESDLVLGEPDLRIGEALQLLDLEIKNTGAHALALTGRSTFNDFNEMQPGCAANVPIFAN